MMLSETRMLNLMNSDAKLLNLIDSIRGGTLVEVTGGKYEGSGIYAYKIPENYIKKKLAPFIRISPITEYNTEFYDDHDIAKVETLSVDIWCDKSSDLAELISKVDEILKNNDYTQTKSERYLDSDVDLLMSTRIFETVIF